MNLIIYGDSILKGVLLENGRYTVNREWEDRLQAREGLHFTNRSRFGCTIQKALDLIRRDRARSGPWEGTALLELGGNDCDYDWAAISDRPDRAYDCKTPPERFREDYRTAIALLRKDGLCPVLITLPPIHSERYLRFICRNGLSRENILSWLGDVEAISRWQASYSRMVSELAGEESVRLVDVRSVFPSDPEGLGAYLCEDGIHPSRAGQDLIFRTICEGVA